MITLDESLCGEENPALPEHALWLAVIERAMMDYLGRTASLPRPSQTSLNDFFFELDPRPNNLQYICETLFDYPDAANVIRKRVQEIKESNGNVVLKSNGTNRYVMKLLRKKLNASSSSQ